MNVSYDEVLDLALKLSSDEQTKLVNTLRKKTSDEYMKAFTDAGNHLKKRGITEEEALAEIQKVREERRR